MRLKVLQELSQGSYIDNDKITLGQWLDLWIDTYIKPTVRPNTYNNYLMLINRHIKPFIGGIALQKLNTNSVQVLYNTMLKDGRVDGQGGLSVRTVEKIHTVLHKALKQAVVENRVVRNVTDGVTLPQRKQKAIRILSDEERRRFEAVIEGDRLGMAFLFDIYSGLRRGELLALTWSDVNFEKATVEVNRSLARIAIEGDTKKSKLSFQDPKTLKSRRTVAIPTSIIAELRKYRVRLSEEKLKAGILYDDNNLVFCTELGKPLEPRNFNRKFSQLIERSDIQGLNLHGLRHTYATILLENNVHPKIVQEALGHSKISTTLDIYSHVTPEIMRKAANVLDNVYTEKKNPSKVEGKK